jgi:hypothetical protein
MSRLLSRGSQGPDVRAVQDVLNHHVRRLEPLAVDGIFGPLTEARVREFQRSNGLRVDGIVGPETRGALFEETIVPLSILLFPRLQLRTTFPGPGPHRLQPPRLIPPLQWPGPGSPPLLTPPPLTPPFNLRLSPGSTVLLPPLGSPGNALQLQIRVPSRNDPIDPHVQSYNNIVRLIDNLPVDSSFRAFLISKVPDPVTRIRPPRPGFDWGVTPILPPINPDQLGASGEARFTVRVTGDGRPGSFNMNFGAWGDGKFLLDFSRRQGESRPRVEVDGQVFTGFVGSF